MMMTGQTIRRSAIATALVATLVGGPVVFQQLTSSAPQLSPGQRLTPDSEVQGAGAVLRYQSDGNLVLYGPSGPLWASGTSAAAGYVEMQGDGNLVAYNAAGAPYWATDTNAPGAWAEISAEGLHIKAATSVWRTPEFAPGPGGGGGPPTSPSARVGPLRLTPAGFADDSGPVLPLYAHHGNALSLFARDEAAELRELDDVATAGYQGIRYWQQLGCGRETTAQGCPAGSYWRQWVNGPDVTPNYWPTARRFAQALKERGLRAVVSQGDINQLRDRCGYMQKLAALDRELGGFVDFIDGANEGTVTGEGDERALARFVQCYADAGGGGLRSLTSGDSEGTADVNRFLVVPPAQVFDIHSYRDNRVWDWIRHIFSSGYDGHYRLPFGIQSEPAGGGALVSNISHREDADDESVPLMAVASFIGRQAFVWFSGEGVIVQRGLKTEPGFSTTPQAVAWLPKDMLAWTNIYHASSARGILGAVSAAGGAVVRTDCREGNGRAACVIYGPSGAYRLPVRRGFAGRLCNPGDGVCADLNLNAGQTLSLSFKRGRVLIVERFQ